MAKRGSDVKSRDVAGVVESVAQGGHKNFFHTGLAILREEVDARARVGVSGSETLERRTVTSPVGKLKVGGVGRAGVARGRDGIWRLSLLKGDMSRTLFCSSKLRGKV
jgi:hypothetical protein